MRITQTELNRYRQDLDRRSNAAKAYVSGRVLDECRGLSVAEARKRALEIVGDSNGVFGDQAQTIAADLFDEICSAEGIDATSEVFDDVIDYASMEEKVRYYAGDMKDGDINGYAGSLSDLAAFYVKRSAYENMVRNCDRNNVRYARVATGRETCGWCFMLSSRDFVYHSEQTAEHGMHAHCDCIVVPGRRGATKIQGYDPEGMRRRWAMCVDASGGYPDGTEVRARWDAMTDEERAAYKGGWKRFSQLEYSRAVRAEAEVRDSSWLYTGKEPGVKYAPGAELPTYGLLKKKSASFNPDDYSPANFVVSKKRTLKDGNVVPAVELGNEWKDVFVHDALNHSGFAVMTMPKPKDGSGHDKKGVTSPDVSIGGVLWEIKSVENPKQQPTSKNRYKFINAAFESARDNFSNVEAADGETVDMRDKTRVIISTRYRDLSDFDEHRIEDEIRRRVGPGKRAAEAIWIDSSGRVRHYR